MSTSSERPLSRQQVAFLNLIAHYLEVQAEWPTIGYLDFELAKQNMDLDDAVEEFNTYHPSIFTLQLRGRQETDMIYLSLKSLSFAPSAEKALLEFIKAIVYCVNVYPIKRQNSDVVTVTSEELSRVIDTPYIDVVGKLFQEFCSPYHGGFSGNKSPYSIQLRREIKQLRNVETIEDFMRIRYPVPVSQEVTMPNSDQLEQPTNRVFIVHGHDMALRDAVELVVRKLGLDPIILQDEAGLGQTVIEKFEKHSERAQYAIILMSPDDIGYPVSLSAQARPRARQNVVLELGYFMGALDRSHICVITKKDSSGAEIEHPSDINGLVYLSIESGDWRQRLAREMRAAGLPVDANRL